MIIYAKDLEEFTCMYQASFCEWKYNGNEPFCIVIDLPGMTMSSWITLGVRFVT